MALAAMAVALSKQASTSSAVSPSAALETESLDATTAAESVTEASITKDVASPQDSLLETPQDSLLESSSEGSKRSQKPATWTLGFPPTGLRRARPRSPQAKTETIPEYDPAEQNWTNIAKPLHTGLKDMHGRLESLEEDLRSLKNHFHRFRVNVRDANSKRMECEDKTQKVLAGICSFKPVRRAVRKHLSALSGLAETALARERSNSRLDSGSSFLSSQKPSEIQDAAKHAATLKVPAPSLEPGQKLVGGREGLAKPEDLVGEESNRLLAVPVTSSPSKQDQGLACKRGESPPSPSLARFISDGLERQPRLSTPFIDYTPEDLCSSSDEERDEHRLHILEMQLKQLEEFSHQAGIDLFSLKEQVQKYHVSTAERFVELSFTITDERIRRLGAEEAEERLPELLVTLGALKEPTRQRASWLFRRAASAALTTDLQDVHMDLQADMKELRCEFDRRIDPLETFFLDKKELLSEDASSGCNGSSNRELENCRQNNGAEVAQGDAAAIVVEDEKVATRGDASAPGGSIQRGRHRIGGVPSRTPQRDATDGGVSPRSPHHCTQNSAANAVGIITRDVLPPGFNFDCHLSGPDTDGANTCDTDGRSRPKASARKKRSATSPALGSRAAAQPSRSTSKLPSLGPKAEARMVALMEPAFQRVATDVESRFSMLTDRLMHEEESRKQSAKAEADARMQESETLRRFMSELTATVDSRLDKMQERQTSIREIGEEACRRIDRVPFERALWGEKLVAKLNDGIKEFVDLYREERRKYNQDLSLLFPRACASDVNTDHFNITEARLFAQDVRIDAMEEQLGRWSAEKAEMQARISALRTSITASIPSEGSTNRGGSCVPSSRKASSAESAAPVATSSAAAKQQVVNAPAACGQLSPWPRPRLRPRTARERR